MKKLKTEKKNEKTEKKNVFGRQIYSMEKYSFFSFFSFFLFSLVNQLKKLKNPKKLKKLKKPYLAGRYILWKNIVFSVFFSFSNCLGFGY